MSKIINYRRSFYQRQRHQWSPSKEDAVNDTFEEVELIRDHKQTSKQIRVMHMHMVENIMIKDNESSHYEVDILLN